MGRVQGNYGFARLHDSGKSPDVWFQRWARFPRILPDSNYRRPDPASYPPDCVACGIPRRGPAPLSRGAAGSMKLLNSSLSVCVIAASMTAVLPRVSHSQSSPRLTPHRATGTYVSHPVSRPSATASARTTLGARGIATSARETSHRRCARLHSRTSCRWSGRLPEPEGLRTERSRLPLIY